MNNTELKTFIWSLKNIRHEEREKLFAVHTRLFRAEIKAMSLEKGIKEIRLGRPLTWEAHLSDEIL